MTDRRWGYVLTDSELWTALEAFADGEELRGPSVRELQRMLNLSSTSLAMTRMKRLQERGLIERIPYSARYETRSYRLTSHARALLKDRLAS